VGGELRSPLTLYRLVRSPPNQTKPNFNEPTHSPTDPPPGNWRKALEDAQSALKLDPLNVKALFRAARAAAKLGRLEEAGRLIDLGLGADAQNGELCRLKQVRAVGLLKCGGCGSVRCSPLIRHKAPSAATQSIPIHSIPIQSDHPIQRSNPTPQELAPARAAAEEKRQKEAEAEEQLMAPARRLAAALTARGYQLTRPQVRSVALCFYVLCFLCNLYIPLGALSSWLLGGVAAWLRQPLQQRLASQLPNATENPTRKPLQPRPQPSHNHRNRTNQPRARRCLWGRAGRTQMSPAPSTGRCC